MTNSKEDHEYSRHVVLYAKNRYERPESCFLHDMKQLVIKGYAPYNADKASDIRLDWVFLMLKNVMTKYNIEYKIPQILESVVFHEEGFGRSEILDHSYSSGFHQEYGTYMSPLMKTPMEKTLWLMMRALHLCKIKKTNEETKELEWIDSTLYARKKYAK